jgi:hypothetical protein
MVSVPDDPLGTYYPINLEIQSAGTEADPADNTLSLQLFTSIPIYLPLTTK